MAIDGAYGRAASRKSRKAWQRGERERLAWVTT
jgi:hypothetical protein